MSASHLVERILAHLERRTALFERIAAETDLLESLPQDADLSPLLEAQRQRAAEMEHLTREYTGLLREWRAADPGPAERARISTESQRAQILNEQVQARMAGAIRLAKSRSAVYKDTLNSIRRGQGVMRKFRAGGEDSAGYFDTNA